MNCRISRLAALLEIFLFYTVIFPNVGSTKVHYATLFANIDSSDFVLLGECVEASDELFEIEYPFCPGEVFCGPRYGIFRVLDSWKSDYNEDYFTLDYKPINEVYNPDEYSPAELDDTQLPYRPVMGETAYLFIKDNNIVHLKHGGITNVEDAKIDHWNSAIEKLAEISKMDQIARIDTMLQFIRNDRSFISNCLGAYLLPPGREQFFMDNFDELMEQKSERVRWFTLGKISSLIDSSNFDKVIPFLYDSSSQVANSAFNALRGVDIIHTKEIIKEHYDHVSPQLRESIVGFMNYKKCDSCNDIYYKASADINYLVRAEGISVLGGIKEKRASDIIYQAFNDDYPEVQFAALRAVSKNHINADLKTYVFRFINSDNDDIREAAYYILGNLTSKLGLEQNESDNIDDILFFAIKNDKSTGVRQQAIMALRREKSPALEEILPELLFDPDPIIRNVTATTMAYYNNDEYIALIEDALSRETDETTMIRMSEAIERLCEPDPTEGLIYRIKQNNQ